MTVALQYLVTSAVDGPFGSSLTSSHYSDDGARVIRLGNIGDGYWRGGDEAFIPLAYARQLNRHAVVKGDVVVAGLGDLNNPLGRAAVVPDLGHAIVKADCFRLRIDPGRLDARFLVYYMTGRGSAVARERAHGSTRQRLPLGEMLKIRVPVPPLEVQRRIADFLDTETARIDTLLATNHHAATLARERHRVLRLALVGHGVPVGHPDQGRQLPADWSLSAVWRETRNHDSRRIPLNAEERGERPGPYPYWGANSVQGYVDDWLFQGQHVLIGEDGAPFFDDRRDVAWVVDGRFWVNNHAHILEAAGTSPEWLCAVLNIADYSQFVGGSTRDKLTQADLNRIPVPKPTPAEEDQILARLRESATLRDELLRRLNHQADLLHERRQALITAAVTGELEV